MRAIVAFTVVPALMLAACASSAPVHRSATAARIDPVASVEAALDAPGRFEGDAADDERRKARETLLFAEITPGASVFELEAGGGYWTEMISTLVGASGRVVMQNPAGFIPFVKDTLDARLSGGRLANVRQSLSKFDALDAPDASMDVVTWFQGPHELYFKPEDGSSLGDPETSYAEIARILKPGGVFVVVDHRAEDGAPPTSGHDLHRIDPAVVKASATAVGLVSEANWDGLANPEDPLDVGIFEPSIRGRTSQFALRFRKPG